MAKNKDSESEAVPAAPPVETVAPSPPIEPPPFKVRPPVFVVEQVREELLNSFYLYSIVLAPEEGNPIFQGNPHARLEITRVTKEQAEEMPIGSRWAFEMSEWVD